jgi:hypothetical protein
MLFTGGDDDEVRAVFLDGGDDDVVKCVLVAAVATIERTSVYIPGLGQIEDSSRSGWQRDVHTIPMR